MININFDKFNKVGLKAVLDKFNKADLPVADVVADNKAKRESGFQVKTAAINFESGQKLIVKAKAGGSIFQVKLNNKVLPIKHVEDLDKAVDEVISYVKENEKNYEKQLARQKVKVPTIKVANASVAEQITQYQTTVDETTAANEELKVQVDAAVTVRAPKDAEAATLETELKDLETAGEALQKKYDQLKEAA
jgi:flagellar biosynthesis chaperone FliJ